MATFETPFLPANFRFENFSVVITEDAAGLTPPTTILQSDQAFAVTVSWENDGLATGMIAGEWHLLLFADAIGGPPEELVFEAGTDHIFDLTPPPGGGPVSYSKTIDVPAGRLPVVGGHGVTIYKLVVSLTYFDASGTRTRGPIAAFEDSVTIQIYDEG